MENNTKEWKELFNQALKIQEDREFIELTEKNVTNILSSLRLQ